LFFWENLLTVFLFRLEILDLHAVCFIWIYSSFDLIFSRLFGMIFHRVEWIKKDLLNITKKSKMKMIKPVFYASKNIEKIFF
jgi:hypothetical protein